MFLVLALAMVDVAGTGLYVDSFCKQTATVIYLNILVCHSARTAAVMRLLAAQADALRTECSGQSQIDSESACNIMWHETMQIHIY